MRRHRVLLRLAGCLLIAGGLLPLAGPAAANIVVNGGFETGDLSGWVSTNLQFSGADCPGAAQVAEGICEGFFGPFGSDGTLSQVLSTQPGTSYLVSFALQGGGDVPSDFSAKWGSQTLYSVQNPSAGPFVPFSFNAVATGASTTLSFSFRDDAGFIFLDAVSVSAVPEPAGAALSVLGLGLLGFHARRRRRS
jgi:MYXO-CTERM domain-containing protein